MEVMDRSNRSRVARAQPAEIDALIDVMVLAFAGDPVARWMYRDPQRYLTYFGRFVRAFAGKAFSTGTAWCIQGKLGSALSRRRMAPSTLRGLILIGCRWKVAPERRRHPAPSPSGT
jgi:hypothetical protein